LFHGQKTEENKGPILGGKRNLLELLVRTQIFIAMTISTTKKKHWSSRQQYLQQTVAIYSFLWSCVKKKLLLLLFPSKPKTDEYECERVVTQASFLSYTVYCSWIFFFIYVASSWLYISCQNCKLRDWVRKE